MQAAVQYARIGGTLPLPAPYFDIFYAGAVLYVFYLWIGVRGFKVLMHFVILLNLVFF
jgi:hypothetical protein